MSASMSRNGVLVVLLLLGVAGCGDRTESVGAAGAEEAIAHGEQGNDVHHVVMLDSTGIDIANIGLSRVDATSTAGLPVTGTITFDANRVSHIGPRIEGRIVRLAADVGARVGRGEILAVLESPEVGQVRAEEAEAEALAAIASENFQRERRLEEQGISSRKELLDAEAELRRAEASLASARQRLRVLGAAAGQGGQHLLTAPFAGTVVERHASLGEMANPADELFTVANLEQLWIELDIYERDLSRVMSDQPVEITTAAYPGRVFPGRIVYVGDVVDPDRRTVRARVEVPNPEAILKPGMFANALIRVGDRGTPVLSVPRDAVQRIEGEDAVFVPGDLPGEYHVRHVQIGESIGDRRVTILSGLTEGEQIVTTGAFALRSELAESEIGEAGHSH